jgi:hypothetical protein
MLNARLAYALLEFIQELTELTKDIRKLVAQERKDKRG